MNAKFNQLFRMCIDTLIIVLPLTIIVAIVVLSSPSETALVPFP